MSKAQHTPGPLQYHWFKEDDEANCGIFYEPRPGQAYAVFRAPRYQTKEQWEADARRCVALWTACEGISTEALEELLSRGITLKMLIEVSSGWPFADVLAKAKGE